MSESPKPLPQWLIDGSEQVKLDCRRAGAAQADVLMAAGWRFELPEIVNNWPGSETEPWQWYWRSPPKRKGIKGRKYPSTGQAFNALQRQNDKVSIKP